MPLSSTPPEESKMVISPEWTLEEREALVLKIEADIQQLVHEEQEMRKTISYAAPYFIANAAKRSRLEEMAFLVYQKDTQFLQANRRNFTEYII